MNCLQLCLLTLFSVILITAVASSPECEEEQEFSGCNREGKQCVCSTAKACSNPFAFRDVKKCRRALFGDSCRRNNCEHKGQCVQSKNEVYLCKCEGTGYYGAFCENKCPKDRSVIPKEDRHLAEACIY